MPAQWTGEIVGKLHNSNVTRKKLAEQLGMSEKYVLAVLNGKREPRDAEARFTAALEELVKGKEVSEK